MEDKDDPGEIPIHHIGLEQTSPIFDLIEKIMLTVAVMCFVGAGLVAIGAVAYGLYSLGGKAPGFILAFSIFFYICWKIREHIDE